MAGDDSLCFLSSGLHLVQRGAMRWEIIDGPTAEAGAPPACIGSLALGSSWNCRILEKSLMVVIVMLATLAAVEDGSGKRREIRLEVGNAERFGCKSGVCSAGAVAPEVIWGYLALPRSLELGTWWKDWAGSLKRLIVQAAMHRSGGRINPLFAQSCDRFRVAVGCRFG